MIDIHSHIIPNIDDGARSWEESLTMCKMAWEDGTKVLVATPHVFNGVYENRGDRISTELDELRKRLRTEKIELEVLQGAEVYSCPNLPKLLEENPALTLNGTKRFFLLEFPHSVLPPHADQLIFQLTLKNLIPVIVHPERNLHVQSNAALLEGLIRQGALCQITAMSLTGGFGVRASECAYELLRRNCVHVVASDTHGMKGRPPIMSEARKKVAEYAGAEKAKELFETFPGKILAGEI